MVSNYPGVQLRSRSRLKQQMKITEYDRQYVYQTPQKIVVSRHPASAGHYEVGGCCRIVPSSTSERTAIEC